MLRRECALQFTLHQVANHTCQPLRAPTQEISLEKTGRFDLKKGDFLSHIKCVITCKFQQFPQVLQLNSCWIKDNAYKLIPICFAPLCTFTMSRDGHLTDLGKKPLFKCLPFPNKTLFLTFFSNTIQNSV